MSDYQISKVYPSDKRTNRLVSELLIKEGIRKDGNSTTPAPCLTMI